MGVTRGNRILRGLAAALAAMSLVFYALCLLPTIAFSQRREEVARVRWSDGSETLENSADLFGDYTGLNESGELVFERDGKTGTVSASVEFWTARLAAERGSLPDLLSIDAKPLSALESLALYRLLKGRVWYADGCFAWTGSRVLSCEARAAEEMILLSGELPLAVLMKVGARRLTLRGEARFERNLFLAGCIEEVVAEAPYSTDGKAVYLDTVSGKRFLGAVSGVRELTVWDVSYLDEGALLACQAVERLSLPFVGSAANAAGSNFDGLLAYAFSDAEDYLVPASLKEVRVRGGTLVDHAFYRCDALEVIDACGVDADMVASNAFMDCTSLRYLHTPRADVVLSGTFTSSKAPCGCTVYRRSGV